MTELSFSALVALATSDHKDTAIICFEPTAEQALAIEQADGEMANDLHITLAYLGPVGDMDRNAVEAAMREVCSEWGPLSEGKISGIGSFGPDGTNKLTIGLVQAKGLAEFRTELVNKLADNGISLDSEYDFVPHCTLAYGPITDESSVVGLPLDFENLYLYWQGNVMSLPLTGQHASQADFDDEGESSDGASGPDSGGGGEESPGSEGFADATQSQPEPTPPAAEAPADYHVEPKCERCPTGEQFGVLDAQNELMGCHQTAEAAQAQVDALKEATAPEEPASDSFPDTGPPNAGEGDSTMSTGSLEGLSDDDLIAELARRAMSGLNDKLSAAMNADDQEDVVELDTETFGVVATGKPGLPIADKEHPWDASAADARVSKYASSNGSGDPDTFDWPRYGDAFVCRDKSYGHDKGGYKLPFADVIDGKLTMIPKGVFAAASRVGSASIPAEDLPGVKARIARFYKEMAAHFNDPTLKPSWITSEGDPVELDTEELADGPVGEPDTIEPGNNPNPQVGDGGLLGDAMAADYDWQGVLTVEGMPSGDGRMIEPGCLTWRDLPLPLMLKTVTSPGHDGAEFCGWIQDIQRQEPDIIGYGSWADTPAGAQAAAILNDPAGQGRFGVSADIDSAQAEYVDADTGAAVSPEDMLFGAGNVVEKLTAGRVMGATLTPFPAFQEAYIEVMAAPEEDPSLLAMVASGGETWRGDVWRTHVPGRWVAFGEELPLVASGATVTPINEALVSPPASWFNLQPMDEPQPFEVGPDGRCYGLVAQFGTCHIGFKDRCVDVPRNADFRSFYGGRSVVTADGTVVKAGPIVMDTVHPSLRLQASDAQAFYAHTGSTVADVALHINEWGIVAAGAIRPDADPIHVRTLRASDVSPDWRPINRALTLVALLAVNVSGFIVQSLVASGGEVPSLKPRALIDTTTDEVLALVAAGAVRKERTTTSMFAADLNAQADRITALQAEVDQLKAYVREQRAEKAAARFMPKDGFTDGFADTSAEGRRDAAKAGHAMADGSYPIETAADVDKAIRAVGRGKGSHNAIRKHIMRQAKRLKVADKIPADWNKDGSIKTTAQIELEDRKAKAMAVFSGGTCAPLAPLLNEAEVEVDLTESCDCGGTCGDC